MRREERRGATLHGCLVLVLVLPLVATFGMYNAGKLSFHVTVAAGALAGCAVFALRGLRDEALALALVGVPALISAGVAGTGGPIDQVETVSGLLYMAGPVLYGLSAVLRARKHMPTPEVGSEATLEEESNDADPR